VVGAVVDPVGRALRGGLGQPPPRRAQGVRAHASEACARVFRDCLTVCAAAAAARCLLHLWGCNTRNGP
jgi:hypothetical protein